jgi:hypothetical protein
LASQQRAAHSEIIEVMPPGICKLCQNDADLQRSHYLPKALYRLQRTDGEHPYYSSSELIIQDQKQIADYLLCSVCEQRFNEFGEKHVLKLVHRNDEGFKLFEIVRENPYRRRSEGDYTVYRAADIGLDTEPLAHFALSVIWRGTHIWPTFNGRATDGLRLDHHEESLRQYLLGIAPFPNDVAVKVSVALDDESQGILKYPFWNEDQTDAVAFTFIMRGLWFDVVFGSPLPAYVYDNCCFGSREKLIFVGDFNKYIAWQIQSEKQTAKLSKKLEARRIVKLGRKS